MADYKARTITLLRRPWGEADHLGVFLTEERGKIRAVARGTRKPKSKLAPAVQPFVLADIMFGVGKGLDVVAQVQVEESFRPLREDLRRLAHASYWAELVERTVEDDQPAPRVFSLLLACLRLGAAVQSMVIVTTYFQYHLMRELGFEMAMGACPECGRALEGRGAALAPGLGGVVCRECTPDGTHSRPVSEAASALLEAIASGRASQVAGLSPDPQVLREAEGLVRRYVQYHVDANVKSLSFLRQVEGQME